jgi:hypothetical protein
MRALLAILLPASCGASPTEVSCDVVVAGGSTASLAAAITAAEADRSLTVCFTEITDWPGGQMTASGVSAIDFGADNARSQNQPASFRAAMASIAGDGAAPTPTTGSGSPGACWVSRKCFLPNQLVDEWVTPRLASSPNLQVYLRTVIVGAERDADGRLASLTAVRRSAKPGAAEWSARLSSELPDWCDGGRFCRRWLGEKRTSRHLESASWRLLDRGAPPPRRGPAAGGSCSHLAALAGPCRWWGERGQRTILAGCRRPPPPTPGGALQQKAGTARPRARMAEFTACK